MYNSVGTCFRRTSAGSCRCAPVVLALVAATLSGGCEWLQMGAISMTQHPLSGQLTDAAGRGDIAAVDRLIAAGAPLRAPHPLQAAVLQGQTEMVRHLVDRGAPLNGDGRLQSPLWFAAAHADTAITRTLLLLGADVDHQTKEMGTPLHAALYSYNARGLRSDMTRLLLDHGADPDSIQRDEYLARECLATALHAAVFSLDATAVRLLLAAGADPSITDTQARTPLQCARERIEVVHESLRNEVEAIVALLESLEVAGGPDAPR